MKQFARRLATGTDLRLGIEDMVGHYKIAAGAMMSVTGVLSYIVVATSAGDVYSAEGSFIINSCTGTAALDEVNLLLSVTTQTGDTLTGTLLAGCVVAESVEFVVGAIELFGQPG